MTEVEKLRNAQDFITREFQKNGVGKIDLYSWDQGPLDPAVDIYRLQVYRGSKKSVFTFTKTEFLDDYRLQAVGAAATGPRRGNSEGVKR